MIEIVELRKAFDSYSPSTALLKQIDRLQVRIDGSTVKLWFVELTWQLFADLAQCN